MKFDQKKHWETIYESKSPDEVSWTQEVPKTSLDLISEMNVSLDAKIIDIGGGDSKLVDHLLDLGYSNISVLDISEAAISRAKERLGKRASTVTWITSDITEFDNKTTYDVWHDRAAFHFLNTETDIQKYRSALHSSKAKHLIIGTFSNEGPLKCSGINITQYSEQELTTIFENDYALTKHFTENHTTPFGTLQNFLFCRFKKK